MAINYAGFQVQAPRTNQQGILAFSEAMQNRNARNRYGIAQGADIALQTKAEEDALMAQYEQAAAAGDMEAAQGIAAQLVDKTRARYNFLAGSKNKELRGIANMQDPIEQEMALKQAMAYSPDYLKQKQSNQAMGSRKSYAPIPVQIPETDSSGKPILDKDGNPKTKTAYQTFEYDPKTSKWQTGLLDGMGNPIKFEEEKAFARSKGTSKGDIAGEAAGGEEYGDIIAENEAKIVAAKTKAAETAKGMVESEVKLRGLEASLPSLYEVTDKLKGLSTVATYTKTGKLGNAVLRELGFKPTEGADAAAQYSSIVKNQVLPLLKVTFGAQFTQEEGNKLEATLGDPNLSPSEKQAQLNEFIEAKVREIQTQQRYQGKKVQTMEEIEAEARGQSTQPQQNMPTSTQQQGVSADDQAAMQWLSNPENQNHPNYNAVQQKLRAKGLL